MRVRDDSHQAVVDDVSEQVPCARRPLHQVDDGEENLFFRLVPVNGLNVRQVIHLDQHARDGIAVPLGALELNLHERADLVPGKETSARAAEAERSSVRHGLMDGREERDRLRSQIDPNAPSP